MQEHEAESCGAEEVKKQVLKARKGLVKGEEMSDKDVAKLIVVKQSRARRPEGIAEPRRDDASVISEGLQYFEGELQVRLLLILEIIRGLHSVKPKEN